MDRKYLFVNLKQIKSGIWQITLSEGNELTTIQTPNKVSNYIVNVVFLVQILLLPFRDIDDGDEDHKVYLRITCSC